MPAKMAKATLIYGPVGVGSVNWSNIAKALKKRFKRDVTSAMSVQNWCKSEYNQHKAEKSAYAKVGKIGKQYLFRIKTAGLLKSSHLGDVVLINDIDETEKLVECAGTDYKIAMIDKSHRDVFRAYLHSKYGLAANELAFWEQAATPNLTDALRKKIYELYVASGSKHEVNLNSKNRKTLVKQAADGDYSDMDFSDAREDVYKMLKGKFQSFGKRLHEECGNKFWPGPVSS